MFAAMLKAPGSGGCFQWSQGVFHGSRQMGSTYMILPSHYYCNLTTIAIELAFFSRGWSVYGMEFFKLHRGILCTLLIVVLQWTSLDQYHPSGYCQYPRLVYCPLSSGVLLPHQGAVVLLKCETNTSLFESPEIL